jgi:hypothetical protein
MRKRSILFTAILSFIFFLTFSIINNPVAGNGSAASDKPSRTARIYNSGSTNTLSWNMAIKRSGRVIIEIEGYQKPLHGNMPMEMTDKFFQDLDAAMPIENLPPGHCLKTASFGTLTSIFYDGQLSPDISCPDGDQEKALYRDVKMMEKLMGITNLSRYIINPFL